MTKTDFLQLLTARSYLGQPFGVARVSGNQLHQSLEPVVDGGLCQRCIQQAKATWHGYNTAVLFPHSALARVEINQYSETPQGRLYLSLIHI